MRVCRRFVVKSVYHRSRHCKSDTNQGQGQRTNYRLHEETMKNIVCRVSCVRWDAHLERRAEWFAFEIIVTE